MEAVSRVATENDGIAAVARPEVHAKTVGEANEFMPGLGAPEGVAAIDLGRLGESKSTVPFAGVPVMHFFDHGAAGGGSRRGCRRYGAAEAGEGHQADQESFFHNGKIAKIANGFSDYSAALKI